MGRLSGGEIGDVESRIGFQNHPIDEMFLRHGMSLDANGNFNLIACLIDGGQVLFRRAVAQARYEQGHGGAAAGQGDATV